MKEPGLDLGWKMNNIFEINVNFQVIFEAWYLNFTE